MEENKFEKQVQQKMGELKIQPSDSVWDKVNNRIEKRKERRWEFLILFLFIGALLTGAFWYYNSSDNATIVKKTDNSDSVKRQEATVATNNGKAEEQKTALEQEAIDEKDISNAVAKNPDNGSTQKLIPRQGNTVKRNINRQQHQGNMIVAQNAPKPERINLSEQDPGKKLSGPEILSLDAGIKTKELPTVKNENKTDEIIVTKDSVTFTKTPGESVSKNDSLKRDAGSKKIVSSKNKWHVGFFIAGGISHVGNQFLGLGYASADYLQNASSAPGSVQYSNPSKVKNGGAFTGGLFLEKNISSKAKFSFGINYKEFNTSNFVGRKNDSTGSYSGNSTGKRYHNNFKFMELPLSISIQLGKSKNLPLSWNGGINISRLISSNALQFDPGVPLPDPDAKAYFIDNSFFNKTQLGFSTGLSTPFLTTQRSTILFGPYFYYTASQLAGEGLYNKKHFVSFGLHTKIIFEKK